MDSEPQKSKPNRPPGKLEQLQILVRHLLEVWPGVLQRREFLRRMAQSEVLREAFADTYAGHVFNAMHGALSGDLVRSIGAYILDRNSGSASVARAIIVLRKPAVLAQLQAHVYGMVPRTRSENPATTAASEHLQNTEFKSIIDELPAELRELQGTVIDAPMAKVVEEIRHKLIAHAAIEYDGKNWKVWTVGSTQLTYSQLDDYIDECTKAVDKLSHRVLRHAYSFADQPKIDQQYADEYIEALVKGLTQQKQERERKRQENLRQTKELVTNAKHEILPAQ
jgi:AbiU2